MEPSRSVNWILSIIQFRLSGLKITNHNLFQMYYKSKDVKKFKNRNAFKLPVSNRVMDMLKANFTRELEFYDFCKQRLFKQYQQLNLDWMTDIVGTKKQPQMFRNWLVTTMQFEIENASDIHDIEIDINTWELSYWVTYIKLKRCELSGFMGNLALLCLCCEIRAIAVPVTIMIE